MPDDGFRLAMRVAVGAVDDVVAGVEGPWLMAVDASWSGSPKHGTL